ncbi:Hypothetical protein PBC10988_18990 [Planctomycetales bacterium 10988]|nr:Hypothetical protein PBC10988_18990 [Planctomycetales bacterium 10988]
MKTGFWLRGVGLFCLFAMVGCEPHVSMEAERQLVVEGQYEKGIEALETYLRNNPESAEASRAAFFLGKAHLGADKSLDGATIIFEKILRDFPDSLEAHKSKYKLGMIALWMGDIDMALARFRPLAEVPDGPLAPEARQMVLFLERFRTEPVHANQHEEGEARP